MQSSTLHKVLIIMDDGGLIPKQSLNKTFVPLLPGSDNTEEKRNRKKVKAGRGRGRLQNVPI